MNTKGTKGTQEGNKWSKNISNVHKILPINILQSTKGNLPKLGLWV
jgi:hypothetical protein